MLTDYVIDEFRKMILDYYHEHPRSFPWRETFDPYSILVSEIMLQQTQTERVVPKYKAWLDVFPDTKALAAASLADVLPLWNGLGYNRRARFLHEAAKVIVNEQGNIFPRSPDALDALPGVGPYTARAVCTFAFGNPEVFIETNIRSVFIFFFFKDAGEVSDSDIMPLIKETLFQESPREWYYALMDYGAALKKTVKNPNRRSAHYSVQSRFEGSPRQARGAILRALSEYRTEGSGTSGEPSLFVCETPVRRDGLTLEEIASCQNIDIDRIAKAAEDLIAEGMVLRRDGFYVLPS